jgi:hypothetical protein
VSSIFRWRRRTYHFGLLLGCHIVAAEGVLETLSQLKQLLRLWLPRHVGNMRCEMVIAECELGGVVRAGGRIRRRGCASDAKYSIRAMMPIYEGARLAL